MENKIRYLCITVSIGIAFILYYAGVRKIRFRRKNFFYTSLLITLTFIGCNFSETNAKVQADNNKPGTNSIGEDDPEYIKDLNSTREWKAFKEFWKGLDGIEAAKNTTPYSYSSYYENADYNRSYKLHDSLVKGVKEMEPVLKKLSEQKFLDTLETRLLLNMCNERIDYIFYGHKSMMMRMVVHPGITEKENTMANIEFRIDTLLQLGQKGLIDSDEMKKALENISIEIKRFGVLDIFDKYYMFHVLPYEIVGLTGSDTSSVTSLSTYGFEKSYNDFMSKYNPLKADDSQKVLFSKYVTTKKELESFTKDQDRFCTIINDLIMND